MAIFFDTMDFHDFWFSKTFSWYFQGFSCLQIGKYLLISSCEGRLHEKKSSCSFGFCKNYLDPPSPKFGQLVPLFFNTKNVDLSDIQNDSLSKILKAEYLLCGSCIQPKNSLKFKLLAFWRKQTPFIDQKCNLYIIQKNNNFFSFRLP